MFYTNSPLDWCPGFTLPLAQGVRGGRNSQRPCLIQGVAPGRTLCPATKRQSSNSCVIILLRRRRGIETSSSYYPGFKLTDLEHSFAVWHLALTCFKIVEHKVTWTSGMITNSHQLPSPVHVPNRRCDTGKLSIVNAMGRALWLCTITPPAIRRRRKPISR
jgi:hypothetical protein